MWKSLMKFEASTGQIYWTDTSEAQILQSGDEVNGFPDIASLERGQNGLRSVIGKVLAPVPNPLLPMICIGVNYAEHAQEAKIPVPQHPVMWYKPPKALANPDENIPVSHQTVQSFLDFEGELVIITSKDAKDITPAQAKDYILGYTIGNDLTARVFQDTKNGGGQYTFAKAMDKFGPIGPVLINPEHFNVEQQSICTRVNGEIMQHSRFDFIHTPEQLISFLSTGTTLPAGTAIFTGTPHGVGISRKPARALKPGDFVEIEVGMIGILRNKIVEQPSSKHETTARIC